MNYIIVNGTGNGVEQFSILFEFVIFVSTRYIQTTETAFLPGHFCNSLSCVLFQLKPTRYCWEKFFLILQLQTAPGSLNCNVLLPLLILTNFPQSVLFNNHGYRWKDLIINRIADKARRTVDKICIFTDCRLRFVFLLQCCLYTRNYTLSRFTYCLVLPCQANEWNFAQSTNTFIPHNNSFSGRKIMPRV